MVSNEALGKYFSKGDWCYARDISSPEEVLKDPIENIPIKHGAVKENRDRSLLASIGNNIQRFGCKQQPQ